SAHQYGCATRRIMDNLGKTRVRSVFAIALGICVLALLAPASANAQATIKHVLVTLEPSPGFTGSTATYCDTNGTSCQLPIWDLGTGITLAGGQTLALSQTALLVVGGVGIGGNFDTSDRVRPPAPTTMFCNATNPCTVRIAIDSGSGLNQVFSSGGPNPLNNGNLDPGSGTHREEAPWGPIVGTTPPNYTLQLGYADNVHGCISG